MGRFNSNKLDRDSGFLNAQDIIFSKFLGSVLHEVPFVPWYFRSEFVSVYFLLTVSILSHRNLRGPTPDAILIRYVSTHQKTDYTRVTDCLKLFTIFPYSNSLIQIMRNESMM